MRHLGITLFFIGMVFAGGTTSCSRKKNPPLKLKNDIFEKERGPVYMRSWGDMLSQLDSFNTADTPPLPSTLYPDTSNFYRVLIYNQSGSVFQYFVLNDKRWVKEKTFPKIETQPFAPENANRENDSLFVMRLRDAMMQERPISGKKPEQLAQTKIKALYFIPELRRLSKIEYSKIQTFIKDSLKKNEKILILLRLRNSKSALNLIKKDSLVSQPYLTDSLGLVHQAIKHYGVGRLPIMIPLNYLEKKTEPIKDSTETIIDSTVLKNTTN